MAGDRPRYYQDAAIRAVLERVALAAAGKERPRALLSLATGAGKTCIAVSILQRLSDSGQLKRALFLVDRDELRDQANTRFHNVFGADAKIVREATDGSNQARNARVHIATYQSLGIHETGDASFLRRHYPANHFSHILIDECHRSAWGTWSEVLTRNGDAFQIGQTATPRELTVTKEDQQITADNLRHFGEPVYEYSLAQGIEDGYLADARTRGRDVRRPVPVPLGQRLSEAENHHLLRRRRRKADHAEEANRLLMDAAEASGKAQSIEDAVYDLKAVNPREKKIVDSRTPAQLLEAIAVKGREVDAALERLRLLVGLT